MIRTRKDKSYDDEKVGVSNDNQTNDILPNNNTTDNIDGGSSCGENACKKFKMDNTDIIKSSVGETSKSTDEQEKSSIPASEHLELESNQETGTKESAEGPSVVDEAGSTLNQQHKTREEGEEEEEETEVPEKELEEEGNDRYSYAEYIKGQCHFVCDVCEFDTNALKTFWKHVSVKHKMDAEYFRIPQSAVEVVNKSKATGKRVCSVGTTSMRSIETAVSATDNLKAAEGWTNTFIYPPYEFSIADSMITNFHLPKSSLLIMVCAFGGYDLIMDAYREAIKEKYRFFSYGDAMLII